MVCVNLALLSIQVVPPIFREKLLPRAQAHGWGYRILYSLNYLDAYAITLLCCIRSTLIPYAKRHYISQNLIFHPATPT